MKQWPICPLCQTATGSLDEWGICQRVSITHAAIRHPDRYPLERHREVWELIASGRPVFPLPPEQVDAPRERPPS